MYLSESFETINIYYLNFAKASHSDQAIYKVIPPHYIDILIRWCFVTTINDLHLTKNYSVDDLSIFQSRWIHKLASFSCFWPFDLNILKSKMFEPLKRWNDVVAENVSSEKPSRAAGRPDHHQHQQLGEEFLKFWSSTSY